MKIEPSANNTMEKLHILVADDDKMSQTLAKILLKKTGCTFQMVDNGAAVIEALEQQHFDLILMDIEMPVMDGYETTLKIRRTLPAPINTIPIIAITADNNPEHIAHYATAGINAFITKPLVYDDLITQIGVLIKPR